MVSWLLGRGLEERVRVGEFREVGFRIGKSHCRRVYLKVGVRFSISIWERAVLSADRFER